MLFRSVATTVQSIDQLASACIAGLDSNDDYAAFSRAINSVQRYEMKDFVDLGDLCTQLIARSPRPTVQTAAKAVIETLTGKGGLITASVAKGAGVARSTGVSIYFPTVGDVSVAYEQLDFAQDTRWAELIRKYKEA